MPKFSVIVPVYRVEKYIRQCIESIVNQTFTDFEAIFVDDCGGDNSINIVEEYAKNDNRIKILKHDKNKGISAARNTALDYATGEYLTCIDSDDWFELNTLEILYKNFQENDINSVWFDGNRFYEDSQTFDKESVVKCIGGFLTLKPETICNYNELTCGKSYRTSTIKEHNIKWPIGINLGEDGIFYYEYFAYNPKIMIIEDRLYNYRMRENSAVRSALKGDLNLDDLYNAIRVLKDFYKERNLYEAHKITILKFMQKSLNFASFNWGRYDDALPKNKEIIQELDLEHNFKEFDVPLHPLVSVILRPDTDMNNYLKHFKQIQNQSYKNIEIICTINPNDKKLFKYLETISKKDSRIKISNDISDILKIAKGDFIIHIKPTDEIKYTTIQAEANKYIENPEKYINQ